MPTPRTVQAILRQRTSLVIDRTEAQRLIGIVMADPACVDLIEVVGCHPRSGARTTAFVRATEVLVPPERFVEPA
jgi:hypothetical protein